MNTIISQQVPLLDAGITLRPAERPRLPIRIAAVTGPEKTHDKDGSSASDVENTVSEERLAKEVNKLNAQLQEMQHSLRFNVDDDSGRIVVKVIDRETDEVIRQIPSEEMLAIINQISRGGLIFNEEA